MVKFKVTPSVKSHRWNPRYRCVVVEFDTKEDQHVRVLDFRPLRFDWLPTDQETKEYVTLMVKHSPTFLGWLRDFMVNFGEKRLERFI